MSEELDKLIDEIEAEMGERKKLIDSVYSLLIETDPLDLQSYPIERSTHNSRVRYARTVYTQITGKPAEI